MKQSGMSFIELLISLLISTLIVTTMTGLYLSSKKQYLEIQTLLEEHFELQWLSELLSNSVRRAGFTPCLGINQLKTADRRHADKALLGLKWSSQSIAVHRMHEAFAEIVAIQGRSELLISDEIEINKNHPYLIADCDHAEVHQILAVHPLMRAYQIQLKEPLLFSYAQDAYFGEWLEEQWLMKKNAQGENTLHYQSVQTEELSPLIHALQVSAVVRHGKQLIKVLMTLDHDKTHEVHIAVRCGS